MKVFVILAIAVAYAAAQRDFDILGGGGSMLSGDCYSKIQSISNSAYKFHETVKRKTHSYKTFFDDMPSTKSIVCSLKSTLEEFKYILSHCHSKTSFDYPVSQDWTYGSQFGTNPYSITKWMHKLQELIRLVSSFCTNISSRGPQLTDFVSTVNSFSDDVASFKNLVQMVDVNTCDDRKINDYELQLQSMKNTWKLHESGLSSLLTPGLRGRNLDGLQVQGDLAVGNDLMFSIVNSKLNKANINAFNSQRVTTNNFGPRRHHGQQPQPQPQSQPQIPPQGGDEPQQE